MKQEMSQAEINELITNLHYERFLVWMHGYLAALHDHHDEFSFMSILNDIKTISILMNKFTS